jgi:hypothetical protein
MSDVNGFGDWPRPQGLTRRQTALHILLPGVSRRSWIYHALAAVWLAGLAIVAMQFSRGPWVT